MRFDGWLLDLANAASAQPTDWGWAFMTLGVAGLGAAWCAHGLVVDRPRTERAQPVS